MRNVRRSIGLMNTCLFRYAVPILFLFVVYLVFSGGCASQVSLDPVGFEEERRIANSVFANPTKINLTLGEDSGAYYSPQIRDYLTSGPYALFSNEVYDHQELTLDIHRVRYQKETGSVFKKDFVILEYVVKLRDITGLVLLNYNMKLEERAFGIKFTVCQRKLLEELDSVLVSRSGWLKYRAKQALDNSPDKYNDLRICEVVEPIAPILAGAGSHYPKIGQAQRGDQFYIQERANGWIRVGVPDVSSWIYETQLRFIYDEHLENTLAHQDPSALKGGNNSKLARSETVSKNESIVSSVEVIADVDVDIPKGASVRNSAVAVVIGNSDYTCQDVPTVTYAKRDASTIKKYLTELLGYQEGNIIYMENATGADFRSVFGTKDYPGRLANTIKEGKSDVFVYYSGHGAPDPNSKQGFFIPVNCCPDCNISYLVGQFS